MREKIGIPIRLKNVCKESFHSILRLVHLGLASNRLPSRVAIYLHSLDPKERQPFRDMLQWCVDQGLVFVDTDRYISSDCPNGAVNVSFDDNHSGWRESLPILSDFGVPATFYINTCVLDGRSTKEEIDRYYDIVCHKGLRMPLSSEGIVEICDAGHTIGAHTHSHIDMRKVGVKFARTDLEKNRSMLESILGRPVRHFSYPFGVWRHFSPELGEMVRELGFDSIAAATPGMLYTPGDGFWIQRTYWRFGETVEWNAKNFRVNGEMWVKLTSRSPIG